MSFAYAPRDCCGAGPMTGFTPSALGDIVGRRAAWEPINGAASAAQPMPPDAKMSDHYATADDGAQIHVSWHTKHGATGQAPSGAVLPRRRLHLGSSTYPTVRSPDRRRLVVCRCCRLSTAHQVTPSRRRSSTGLAEQEIGDQTYYRWRQKYGLMTSDEAKRLKLLERENAQIKAIAADTA